MTSPVATRSFPSLGGLVRIDARGQGAEQAVKEAEALILDLHDRLTRFEAESELSLLNDDPREAVPASPLMVRFAESVQMAGSLSEGLVDATMLDEIERAGYVESIDPDAGSGIQMVAEARTSTARAGSWADVKVDRSASTVIRPPGLRLDSGGLGKGLAADLVAERLEGFESWSATCAGDLRFGGTGMVARRIEVSSPHSRTEVIASLTAEAGAVATSGTTRRSWQTGSGSAHHLIDPRTGEPAGTGVIQVTAAAPTAVEAEVRAKAALLSGPATAHEWLPDGGVVVTEDMEILCFGFEKANLTNE